MAVAGWVLPHDSTRVKWALRCGLQADVTTCSSKAGVGFGMLPETRAADKQPGEAVGCAFLPKLAPAEPPCRYTSILPETNPATACCEVACTGQCYMLSHLYQVAC